MGRAPAKKRRSNSPDWIASGRKLDWHASGHRQQTKCHWGNDEPQLCTCCDRESTGVTEARVQRASPNPLLRHFSNGRTAGRMISNLADESLPGSCQMSGLVVHVGLMMSLLPPLIPDSGGIADVMVCGT